MADEAAEAAPEVTEPTTPPTPPAAPEAEEALAVDEALPPEAAAEAMAFAQYVVNAALPAAISAESYPCAEVDQRLCCSNGPEKAEMNSRSCRPSNCSKQLQRLRFGIIQLCDKS